VVRVVAGGDPAEVLEMNPLMRWIWLGFWVLLCFAVAGVSGSSTAREVVGWYRGLIRPGFAPPNWIFGPVWSLLYAMMAVAAWLVTVTPASNLRNWGIGVFLVQLGLNFAWSWLFFSQHRIGLALVEIVLLWLAILACTLVFNRVSPAAGRLMMPYLAWVSFATLLNAGFWRLNR
jgi:tryptophan-rich sensory protein